MLDIITRRLTVAEFLEDIEPKYPDWGAELRSEFADVEDLPFIRKGFELTPEDMEFLPGERAEIATISTLALDRDDEVLLPEGADLRFYKKNPVVPYAHDYWALPVGKNLWVKIDNKEAPTALVAKTKYATKEANPIAEQVYLLHQEGILTAKSVGFIPLKYIDNSDDNYVDAVNAWRARREAQGIKNEGDPRRIYTKWMLLEYSPVAVPSNPEALSMAISKGILTQEDAVARGLVEETTLEDSEEGIEEETLLTISEDLAVKPYANEHACRLKNPDQFDSFARQNCKIKHDDKCIDVIFGIKDGKSQIQAYRYPKDVWTAATAKKHCTDHDGSFEAAKEESYLRLHPDDRELLVNTLEKLGKSVEPEDVIEIEDDDSDLDIDPEMVKELVVTILAEPKDDKPSPQEEIRLERGEIM